MYYIDVCIQKADGAFHQLWKSRLIRTLTKIRINKGFIIKLPFLLSCFMELRSATPPKIRLSRTSW